MRINHNPYSDYVRYEEENDCREIIRRIPSICIETKLVFEWLKSFLNSLNIISKAGSVQLDYGCYCYVMGGPSEEHSTWS